ncbi:MAG: 2-oxoglutarate dehydrogenase complex dihydrolipoyllysine-residue succinyltransferase [Candidatus Mycalebacterium zealandia]|nr:MAG: 2-oxoglutarate dehydrogenase complex dihydrolipoyllysine-residue succinyltransferase [Candidatus Mycalebacterium zealandia]
MATQIVVPELGDSVIDATVVKWLKHEGDPVKTGETVVELETEKANFEVPAITSGVVLKIGRNEGDEVKVGDALGEIDESASAETETPQSESGKSEAPPEPAPASDAGKASATPVAKNIARNENIDLSKVEPKTEGGRITKADVEQAAADKAAGGEETPAGAGSDIFPSLSALHRGETRVKMTPRRKTIARRMLAAQHEAAILSTFNEVDMGAVMELRKRRKDAFKEKHGVSLGMSSFFIKASVGALKAFPQINSEIQGDEILYKNFYDIGIAIGASSGLVVPVIRDADKKSFAELEKEVRELAEKAEEGKLKIDELMGGTFSITNGGVFGSMLSTPILNPPQVGILGLHAIKQRPAVVDGEVVIRPIMFVALSYDHRVVDGREAVQFLVRLKELVEDPESLLVDG